MKQPDILFGNSAKVFMMCIDHGWTKKYIILGKRQNPQLSMGSVL